MSAGIAGTYTSEGYIPHLKIASPKYGILFFPVRVMADIKDLQNRPFPEKDSEGAYRYAYPGGGSITKEGVQCLSSVCATSAES